MGAWTETEIETVKVLWIKGLTGSQIAERLPGRTRNAVIGCAHRMKLLGRRRTKPQKLQHVTKRAKTARRKAEHIRTAAGLSMRHATKAQVKTARLIYDTAVARITAAAASDTIREIKGRPATILDLEPHHCRYMIGERHWCAHDKIPGSSYCATHTVRCYVQPRAEAVVHLAKTFDPSRKMEPVA